MDASSLGTKQFMAGPAAIPFSVWILLVRLLEFKIVLHENVPQCGRKPLADALSDKYIVLRVQQSPLDMGWPVRRPRQICLLVLKEYVQSTASPSRVFGASSFMDLDFEAIMKNVFFRRCGFHFHEFRIATEDELLDFIGMLGRRTKAGNHFEDSSSMRMTGAPPPCYLTPTEADRIDRYHRMVLVLCRYRITAF